MTHSEFPHDQAQLPVENNDDAALRALGGASFGPNATLTLPSGKQLSSPEAQALTSAFDAPAPPPAPARTPGPEQDQGALDALRGANFGPEAMVTLPSGKKLKS